MNEFMIQYWRKATQYWNQVNRTQKIVLISTVAFLVLTIIILTYHFSKTEYVNAFTDLDPRDASGITAYLDDAGIPYKLSTDGRTIGVPTAMASKTKIDVESQGLMKNGSLGYGIFRENLSSFGMTENEFDVVSIDARAGEIQLLINSITGVSNSKVLINLPKESIFVNPGEPETASASVVVTFKPGYPPDQVNIDTIYNLVEDGVPNLPMENITISDQNGIELLPSSKLNGGVGNSTSIVSQQFKIKKQFESDIRSNVHQLLGTLLGSDKVVVSVVATLNFDKKNAEEIEYSPVVDQQGIERSVQEIQKSFTSEGGASTGGVPGTGTSDVPGYQGGDTSGSSNSEELQRTINYEVNQITRQVVSSPYAVRDLTINVGIEPPDVSDPESLTQDTKDAIQHILTNIVGASLADSGTTYTDEELARKVVVLTHSFQGRTVQSEGSLLNNPMFYILGAAALALAFTGGYFVFRRRKKEIVEEELPSALPIEFPTIDVDTVTQDNQVRKQLETLSKKKPEEFVNLLRTWLVDE